MELKSLLKQIPKSTIENIEFRIKLHSWLATDKAAQSIYMDAVKEEPKLLFNTAFCTYNPKNEVGFMNMPFILRPTQEKAVDDLTDCIKNKGDAAVVKSRDEGATELVCKLFLYFWLFFPQVSFLVGSRKEEYVDKGTEVHNGKVIGNHKAMFHKILYGLVSLPDWMKPNFVKQHLHLENLDTGATIDGESTNENFAAGDRRTAILLDEFGALEKRIADSICDRINDVADCVIYNSTHYYGIGHTFNKILSRPSIKKVVLPWYSNPTKNHGLYLSPNPGELIVDDIKYYREKCPDVFNAVKTDETIKHNDLLLKAEEAGVNLEDIGIKFISDGCENIPGHCRSPWHDEQEKRRSKQDLAQNVWMDPTGVADSIFDAIILNQLRAKCSKPDKVGELNYKLDENRKVNSFVFVEGFGKRRLSWWGELFENSSGNLIPDQTHNYVIGSDISLGTGASNSVSAIYDVNLNKIVGIWACPNTSPEDFADQTVALGYWCGGVTKRAFLIWEANGGMGINFGRRVLSNGYSFAYQDTDEISKNRKRKNRFGWQSTKTSKQDLLTELYIGFKESLNFNGLKILDGNVVDEMDGYIFYDDGSIGASSEQDLNSGARERHGDRVIAVGLAYLGRRDQRKAMAKEQTKMKVGSFDWRRARHLVSNRNKEDWGEQSSQGDNYI